MTTKHPFGIEHYPSKRTPFVQKVIYALGIVAFIVIWFTR